MGRSENRESGSENVSRGSMIASAAAALLGCLAVAETIPAGQTAVMVTVFADSAAKYLSERFWDEDGS